MTGYAEFRRGIRKQLEKNVGSEVSFSALVYMEFNLLKGMIRMYDKREKRFNSSYNRGYLQAIQDAHSIIRDGQQNS